MTTKTPKFNLQENLQEKYVAFLDVMGFSNLVSKGSVANLESYFEKITDELDNMKKDKAEIESFLISDSIILIAPNTKKDLHQLFSAIRRIQSALLWRKILLRGAVSFGQIYFNQQQNIIVGKGFIKAYHLEAEAIYPRVIIDPSIIKNLAVDKAEFLAQFKSYGDYQFENRVIYTQSQFSKISDDAIFIDYACKIIRKDYIGKNMKMIYATIAENMYGEQKLYAKYVWMRDYFIECLQLTCHSLDDSKESKIHKANLTIWIEKFNRL